MKILLLSTVILLSFTGIPKAAQPGLNIALNKPYTMEPEPNYPHCLDDGDAVHLTDGIYTTGPFWTTGTTVGWSVNQPVMITVDLQEEQPIAGVSFNTAANYAVGVRWPWSIVILTSSDGETWYRAGDLVRLSVPPPDRVQQETIHRFYTGELQTKGRFVRFLVGKSGYILADEIEVYRGRDEWLERQPAGSVVTDMKQAELQAQGVNAMQERLRADLQDAAAAIEASNLTPLRKEQLLARVQRLTEDVAALPDELPADYTTIMPFSPLQARIFALHSPVRQAAGFAPLTAWAAGRWDPLLPIQAPAAPPASSPALEVRMLHGEHRAAAFNLTNSTDRPLAVTIHLEGLAATDGISVREVLFTDTYVRRPIAAALPEAALTAGGRQVGIPAGMTRQVWLSIDSRRIPPGTYRGQVKVTAPDLAEIHLPFDLYVSQLEFPSRPSIHIGGWEYSEGEKSARDAAVVDQQQFITRLREYYVDMPWASGLVTGARFDDEGRMTTPPDFTVWDNWVAKWPDARLYAVYGLGSDFEGAGPGTPRFQRIMAEWLGALVDHMQNQGLAPEQLVLLLVDEPHTPEQDANFLRWAEAVQQADTGAVVWINPCHDDPADADPRLYEVADALSPSAARFVGSPQSYRDFFTAQKDARKDLWFYSCVNGKHLDPITYHRGQFWLAIEHGAVGSCFWAWGDEGGSGSSFRAYTSPWHMFSPLFLDPDMGVIDGKHMEAVREGAQDYEYFMMLRGRVEQLEAQGHAHPVISKAKQLLEEGPGRVTREITIDRLDWTAPKDRESMDRVRLEALDLLEQLAAL